MEKKNFLNLSLLLAFVLYGLFSSPTPDVVSWAEVAIGLLLLVSAGVQNILLTFSGAGLWSQDIGRRYLTACFLLLLVPGVVNGFISGHDPGDIIRDLIPLGFFFLSLFLYQRGCQKELLYGLVFTGVMFALRFWPASGLTLSRFGLDRGNDEMLYLTSSPSVMFAGLFLLFKATELRLVKLWLRVLCMAGAAVCLFTLIATLQRAAIFLAALSVFFIFWHRTQKSLNFLFALVATLFLGGIFLAPVVSDIVGLIWRKTVEVGDNERFAELFTVFHAMGNNPLNYLFGLGWGAKIVTAASGYADVRYTHMLLSYALMKTGLLGLFATIAYAGWIARRIFINFPHHAALICAALPSIILGFTLYPSFKMLCLGGLIALVSLQQQTQA